jgi:hypothetical protein
MPTKKQSVKTTQNTEAAAETKIARIEAKRQNRIGFDQFSDSLNDARVLWRRYPHLVESEEFPEPFLSEYRRYAEQEGLGEPDETRLCGERELVEAGFLQPAEPKKSMSIYEIRRAMQRGGARDPNLAQIAESFSVAGADGDELVHLAVCQALYRRGAALPCELAPLEATIECMVRTASYRPFTLKDLDVVVGDARDWWARMKVIQNDLAEAATSSAH